MRQARNGFLFLLTVGLLLVSAGCPNSTPIGAGNGSVLLSISNANVGKWGGAAFFSVDRAAIRPLDPAANTLLGARSLLLLQDSIVIDGTVPDVDPGFFSTIQLSAGQYEITELTLANFVFFEANPDFSNTECEFIFAYDTTMTNFPQPLTFTVRPDYDGGLKMTFDIDALAQAVVASYANPAGSLNYPDCDGDLNASLLAANIGTFLTLE
jgi:hypothetical protein